MTLMRPSLVILGSGGHASVVIDAILARSEFTLRAVIDDLAVDKGLTTRFGLPILGGREQLQFVAGMGIQHAIVAIGTNHVRVELAQLAVAANLELVSVIHPRACLANSCFVGKGTFVAAHVVINANAQIGGNVIVNSAAVIEHDCVLHDGVHISPGALLAGGVRVGRNTWVGIGATIIENITIGDNVIVGAGAVVVRDIPSNLTVVGVPARRLEA